MSGTRSASQIEYHLWCNYYRPQRSWGKVIFSQACVILFRGGGGWYSSMHCRWYPSMPCSRSPEGGLLLGGEVPGLGGLLLGGVSAPRGVCSHGGLPRPTPKGEVEGSGPGPHPRRKLRGIRSRPTPKGEIEGNQIQTTPPDNHCCGRYASYWNAFLLLILFHYDSFTVVSKVSSCSSLEFSHFFVQIY